MNSEIIAFFKDYLVNEKLVKSNDILCQLDFEKVTAFQDSFSINSAFSEIYSKSKRIEKETGLNPLCKSFGTIRIKTLNEKYYQSPVLLKEIQVRNENNFFHVAEIGEYFLNPYLYHLLNIDPSTEIRSLEEFKNCVCKSELEINESICLIGNFHPYRFEIFRDL